MDKRYLLAFGMGATSLALGILVVRLLGLGNGIPFDTPPQYIGPPPVRAHDLTGPYTHRNLTVYLIHGEEVLTGRIPLTLDEAMDRKLVRVHETSDVNELEIENVSRSDEVYVQAGDVVRGGKQDRVLAVDLIVPTNSGRIPINSFCVEQGRWTVRGNESDVEFSSAPIVAPSKDLKLAAKHSNSQAQVWEGVAMTQQKLSNAANTNVASSVSRSSLPLALENAEVRNISDDYIRALRDILNGKSDVIGFVFSINGEINSADTYGSHELFEKMWPRILKATAIEAVSESYRGGKESSPSVEKFRDFLFAAESGPTITQRTITDRISMVTRESGDSVFIESRDSDRGAWLHRNYLYK